MSHKPYKIETKYRDKYRVGWIEETSWFARTGVALHKACDG